MSCSTTIKKSCRTSLTLFHPSPSNTDLSLTDWIPIWKPSLTYPSLMSEWVHEMRVGPWFYNHPSLIPHFLENDWISFWKPSLTYPSLISHPEVDFQWMSAWNESWPLIWKPSLTHPSLFRNWLNLILKTIPHFSLSFLTPRSRFLMNECMKWQLILHLKTILHSSLCF